MFCGEREERRDHLFFACPITFTIWTTLTLRLLGTLASPDWNATTRSLLRQNRNKLDSVLLQMVFQTSIYFIWRERNTRKHQGVWGTTDGMIRRIKKAIRNRISSLKYTGNHKLAACWAVSKVAGSFHKMKLFELEEDYWSRIFFVYILVFTHHCKCHSILWSINIKFHRKK